MKKLFFLFFLVFFSYHFSFSQHKRYEDLLHEKVRKPEVVHYLLELKKHQTNKQNFGIPIPDDFPKIEEFLKILKITKKYKKISTDVHEGAEPFIAIDPNNPSRLIVSYISFGESGLSEDIEFPIFYSIDGGTSWTKSEFNTYEAINEQLGEISVFGGGDPVLAIDNNGRVHFTFIYVHGTSFNMFYCYSDNFGQNWTLPNPSKLPTDGLDRQWMAVDNSGGTYDGNLYLGAALLFSDSIGEYVAIKKPQNDMFDSTIVRAVATDSIHTHTQFANIKVDHQGKIHLSCFLYNEATDSGVIAYVNSIDGGQSFSEPKIIATAKNAKQYPDIKIHSRENIASSMAVDNNNVYITWSDFSNDDIRSYYVYSSDGGSTFSDAIEFGIQLINTDSNYHLMPFVCADDGNMVLVWCKIDKQSKSSTYIFSTSLDSGLSLSEPQELHDQSFMHTNHVTNFYGDYNSSDMFACTAHFSFTASAEIGGSSKPVVYIEKRNVCDGLGLSEISPISDQFSLNSIYPNPSKDNIYVDFFLQEKQRVQLDVFNAAGQKVSSFPMTDYFSGKHQLILDVGNYSPNFYLLRMTLQNGLFASRRFVIK